MKTNNVEKIIHRFNIGEYNAELSIECKNGFWEAKSLKKDWGRSGGKYDSLKDFISEVEMSYRYSYNFNNKGYKYAKSNL